MQGQLVSCLQHLPCIKPGSEFATSCALQTYDGLKEQNSKAVASIVNCHEQVSSYRVHPATLDACLQTGAVVPPDGEGAVATANGPFVPAALKVTQALPVCVCWHA